MKRNLLEDIDRMKVLAGIDEGWMDGIRKAFRDESEDLTLMDIIQRTLPSTSRTLQDQLATFIEHNIGIEQREIPNFITLIGKIANEQTQAATTS